MLNGDHLSVPEFERRYTALPYERKAELMEGVVTIWGSTTCDHGEAHGLLAMVLGKYAFATPGVACGINGSLRLDRLNEFQPEVTLRVERKSLARTWAGKGGLLEGSPELVADISSPCRLLDITKRKAVLQRHKVQEYIVWEMKEAPHFHWYSLENGEYVPLLAQRNCIVSSRVFPGLRLDFASLMVGQGFDKTVFRTLDRGLKSAEHKAFVKKIS